MVFNIIVISINRYGIIPLYLKACDNILILRLNKMV